VWLASAISVSSRLWLGGVVRIQRDRCLIRTLLEGVRSCGTFQSLLLCTDGLSSYPKQALKVFSEPVHTGKVGRPRLLLPEGLMIAQAVKRYARRRVKEVLRRVVVGRQEAVEARLSPRRVASRRSLTPPTSSGFKPPSARVLVRWYAGLAQRLARRLRWRRACGL